MQTVTNLTELIYIRSPIKILSMIRSLFILILLHFSFICLAQSIYLHCGKLIDVKNGKVLEKQTVLVENDRISKVLNGWVEVPDGDILIDLKQMTVMPGLMDLHVHVESQSHAKSYMERFTLNEADVALRATKYAEITLNAGFTTVRDLGGSGVNIALRNAINQGWVRGPRIYTAGKSIATTGGHADPTNGYRKHLGAHPGPQDGVADGPQECKKAVRQQYKNGADVIKITATGGVLSLAKSGDAPQFDQEELNAIIQTATDYGMHVAAHAHGKEGMKRAVIAGVRTIEHGTKMDTEVMDLMKKHGTYYVPTITAGKEVERLAKQPGYYPAVVVPKALSIGPMIQKTFQKAYQVGVKIAFGTDAGVFKHGENAREFEYMVEAGMPAMEAIQSATITAAEVLGINDEVGILEGGKFADIIATPENPIDNIKTMRNVKFVMKEGIVIKNELN